MSDTAKELLHRLHESRDAPLDIPFRAFDAVIKVANDAIARIEQLERGIERANDQAVKCLGGWADMGRTTVAPVSYDSLMQLIEELGNEPNN